MRTEAFASPLTVWVGPTRYAFGPDRDVIVGYGPGCDIPLEHQGNASLGPDLVLRLTGRQWVAIDLSHNGIFVNGSRMSMVEIRDGQAIVLGDPQRGPRLIFQLGQSPGPSAPPHGPVDRPADPPPQLQQYPWPKSPSPAGVPPPPVRPNHHDPRVPTEAATQRMRVAPPPPAAPERPQYAPDPGPPVVPPATAPPPVPPPVPPVAEHEQSSGPGLIERMITGKLRVPHLSFRTAEPSSTHRLPLNPEARTLGVAAYQMGLTVDGHRTLSDISFKAAPGTLTAIVGRSAARNSALLGVLAGTKELSSGCITVDGHDVQAEPESMQTRIGMVSRDYRLHRQLTVDQAVRYAAEMRLPGVDPEARDSVVNQVLEELELTPHRGTRISKLLPEVRRCAAMAVELITRPTLLVVEEPGAGLDAAQQSHVMGVLRRQADIGCVVVAAISSQTSLTNINMCDQVLVLTSTGTVAYLGTPLQIEPVMGTNDWSKVLAQVSADPDGANRAFRSQPHASALTSPPEVAAPWPPPAGLPLKRQIGLLARREVRLIFANRICFSFLAVLPFILAGLTLLIPGDSGLDRPHPGSTNLHEAIEILAALNIAAVITGMALTIGALVRERSIYRREQAIGLSASAYLTAKIMVLSVAAAILTAIVFTVVVAVKGGPVHGAVLLHNATIELYLSVAGTAIVSASVGLALSSLGRSLREVPPLLVPVILISVLFNGSLIPLVSKWGFQQLSWFVPAQWGFAAAASTADLRRADALAANAETWTHYSGWWVFDMTMLVIFGGLAAGFTRYRLRPPGRS